MYPLCTFNKVLCGTFASPIHALAFLHCEKLSIVLRSGIASSKTTLVHSSLLLHSFSVHHPLQYHICRLVKHSLPHRHGTVPINSNRMPPPTYIFEKQNWIVKPHHPSTSKFLWDNMPSLGINCFMSDFICIKPKPAPSKAAGFPLPYKKGTHTILTTAMIPSAAYTSHTELHLETYSTWSSKCSLETVAQPTIQKGHSIEPFSSAHLLYLSSSHTLCWCHQLRRSRHIQPANQRLPFKRFQEGRNWSTEGHWINFKSNELQILRHYYPYFCSCELSDALIHHQMIMHAKLFHNVLYQTQALLPSGYCQTVRGAIIPSTSNRLIRQSLVDVCPQISPSWV